MASLSILVSRTGNHSTLSSPSFACSFSREKFHHYHLPLPYNSPKQLIRHKISCKSKEHRESIDVPTRRCIDRRDLLLFVGRFCGAAAGLGLNRRAVADPIQAPDISTCHPPEEPIPTTPPTRCCLPYKSMTIVDFQPPPSSNPLRIRRAAHMVDPCYLAKYKKAVELMKALPIDDPRNFTQQANVHCAYCDGSYDQIGFPNLEIQVHGSWLFFPWHRFYLYFNERILGKLIGDDTFALPFWNWDAEGGMELPKIYTDRSSPLYNELRDAKHQPPNLVDLDFNCSNPPFTPEYQIKRNYSIMYRQVISNGKTPDLFMGEPYSAGQHPYPGAGSLERVPHNTVHDWTGDCNETNREDMGALYSAARDPVFFAHHGNVDRMWYLWKRLGATHQDFTHPDWRNASFLFYDENAQLVRVKVEDCLDINAMRYSYQEVGIPWLSSKPAPKKTPRAAMPLTIETTFPVVLYKAVSATVAMPKMGRSGNEKGEKEKVLVVEGIKLDKDVAVKFDVYINAPDYEGVGPDASEFAGSFVQLPHKHKGRMNTRLKLGITDLLADIGAKDHESVIVTLVPRRGKGKVIVGGLSIDFSE